MKPSEITLRAMEPEDLDLLYGIENDQQLWDVGSTTVPYSRYVLHDYIANSSGDIYTDRQVRLIVATGEGENVGVADIINFDPKHCRAEVGLVIMTRYRRHGYGLQALCQLSHYALHVLHLHQLYAFVDMSNQDSLQLFLQAGYKQSAELNDWLFDGHHYHNAALLQIIL